MYEYKEDDAFEFSRFVQAQTRVRGRNLDFKECPYCKAKDKYTFAIDLDTGKFTCLRASCGVSGNMITLAKDFGFSLGNDIDEYYSPKKKYREFKTPEKAIVPKAPAVKYLLSRGISEEIAKKYEITTQTDHDNILVFPFYDENGKMQFVKYRKTDFDKSKDKNKEWCESNGKPILFGMKQCIDKREILIVTEGQIDSLSVEESGIENAVSVPTGAKGFTWVPYCWDFVKSFQKIIIFGDHEKGNITLLDEFNQRFSNVYHVREEDYKDCKDANDILRKYGKEQIKICIDNAVTSPVHMVNSLSSVPSVDLYKIPKLKTPILKENQLLYGGLPFGFVHILTGKSGEGKSTFASQCLVEAIEQGYTVFAYSGELINSNFKAWMDFQIAGKNNIVENTGVDGIKHCFITNSNQELINRWYEDRMYIYSSSVDPDEKEDILRTVDEVIRKYGVQVVLIDNLMTAMDVDAEPGTDLYEKQSQFVKKLSGIARRYSVLIILVAHRRKNTFGENTNDSVSGSSNITNLAGIVMSYDALTKKEIEMGIGGESDRKLITSKNRLFGKKNIDGYLIHYDEKSKRIYGDMDDVDKKYSWSDAFEDGKEVPFE